MRKKVCGVYTEGLVEVKLQLEETGRKVTDGVGWKERRVEERHYEINEVEEERQRGRWEGGVREGH